MFRNIIEQSWFERYYIYVHAEEKITNNKQMEKTPEMETVFYT